MTVEQRLEQLEKRNKRLTVGLTMMAVAMCAVVTMAAKDDKISTFDTVAARKVFLLNDADEIIVILGATDGGNGLVQTMSAKGNDLVSLSATGGGYGRISTYQPNGKELVSLSSNDNGGVVTVTNKTGEIIVGIKADDYGNGVVWAGDRKGDGRSLKPGP
jgi:hypothetical protein